MSEDLIQTKISTPPLRMQLVHRERFYRRLDAGVRCRLTLVAAPAGFGKSTLLVSWADRQEIPLGWFSLDEQDNDPDRFLAYLLAALQSVAPQLELRERTAALRQTRQGAVDQALLTFLANRVKEYAQPLGIVLDDYHVIANPAVDEILSFLLEHMPLPFHLIVSSRQEPAFPVAPQ